MKLISLLATRTGLVAIVLGGFLVSSCVSDSSDTEDIELSEEYYEFQDFNLSDFEIDGFISLPDETANIGASTTPEITHVQSDIKWEIKVGQNFTLLIEDYADINDLVSVEKKLLAERTFYKIEYIIDDEDLILYQRTLIVGGMENASKAVGFEHKSYHVYGQKRINGITYELKSRPEGYGKMIIELMAKSIKSFKTASDS